MFTSPADGYDRFMGRYTRTLAPELVDATGLDRNARVLDVGCGPGGLTGVLAGHVGAQNVAAIDPAPQFVAACRERHPDADVREGMAEALPWPDGVFDAALSCLVVGFMTDADHGLREMARVTRPGGVVAACMWDLDEGGMTMLETFWAAARRLDPDVVGERMRVGVGRGDIATRLRAIGLRDVADGALTARADYADFDDFWEPFTFAVGPAGAYLAALPADHQEQIRQLCRPLLPDGPFTLEARAWFARGIVPPLLLDG
ncbi:class I SAM-dependent methyltransferase [Gordonia sp. OPL2]|uniref:class I SAM-dependent methyltransferase n=1 Tax=Gordonia sp. OPL2 TaxID=2486274 RepID=UPI00165602E2|nr:class I SAM-dependent methyltransferase [Gordonia sp. OPL2]RPA10377.1 class I SAM-dependent methyltransferase [Gordonia sp. OPL2]